MSIFRHIPSCSRQSAKASQAPAVDQRRPGSSRTGMSVEIPIAVSWREHRAHATAAMRGKERLGLVRFLHRPVQRTFSP